MKKLFLILQIVNTVALSNLVVVSIMQDNLAPVVRSAGLIVSGILAIGSLLGILILSYSNVRGIEDKFERLSSSVTPIFKFVFSNLSIVAVLILVQLGLIYDSQFLTAALIVFIIFIFPTTIMWRTVYVVMNSNEIRLYDLLGNFSSIPLGQINSIDKVLFAAEYRIKYLDSDNEKKTAYFYPRGGSIFHEPSVIKVLKAKLSKGLPS
ncbi:MAG: hypothetical protein ACOYXT_14110 [Bacteroidota bacterium]